METKICKRCELEKDIDEFRVKYDKRYGKFYRSNICKNCQKEQQKEWKENNKAYIYKLEKIRRRNKQRENERMKKVKEHNLRILINRYSSLTKDE